MKIKPPADVGFNQIDSYTVEVKWFGVPDADHYLIRIGNDAKFEATKETIKVIRGLIPGFFFIFQICSVSAEGERSDWTDYGYRTSFPKQILPVNSFNISPIPGYRQVMIASFPAPDGTTKRCAIRLWWQRSDSGWWASLEVPTGTQVVNGRRLGLDCGILDNIYGALNGNIVMRTLLNESIEPDSECFKNKTHELRWEPYS